MKHIFITGCPRSGTTMLGGILNNDDLSVTPPESHFFNDFIYKYLPNKSSCSNKDEYKRFISKHYRFKQWNIDADEINIAVDKIEFKDMAEVIEQTVQSFAYSESKKEVSGINRIDHTPSNILDFKIINELFPSSKFVFILRDPRAIFASIKNLDWGANSALRLSEVWMEYLLHFFLFQKIAPDRIKLVKYEDILLKPNDSIKSLCVFLDIPFKDAMIRKGKFNTPKYTQDQHALVGKQLDQSRINKWTDELTNEEVLIIESKCKAAMSAFDYQLKTGDFSYKITNKDKFRMLKAEVLRYLPNKLKKTKREKNA